jgi:hypothetical protein
MLLTISLDNKDRDLLVYIHNKLGFGRLDGPFFYHPLTKMEQ